MFSKIISSAMIILGLSACGGSSGGSNENGTTATSTVNTKVTTYAGVFLDSAVEGLNYTTASQSGKTDENGQFTYQANEVITFSIGDIQFPTITAAQLITPLTLFNTDDINQIAVVNMLRLLQSLDTDGDPTNNITISDTVHELANGLTIDFAASDFDEQVNTLISNSGATHQALVSQQMATYHFQQTLNALNNGGVTNCASTHSKVGHNGFFETFAHNVSGKATIIDDCTIEISQFSYDSGGPLVYLYGAIDHNYDSDTAFSIGPQLDGQVFNNDTFLIKLPQGKTLDDLSGLSVWCIDFKADFGHMEFTP